MIKIAIIGASGYTGGELARILCNHPHASITAVTSRQYEGKALAEVFPHLRDKVSIICENSDVEALSDKADIFFTAVPHQTAMEIVPRILSAGKKVIDLSADFRIREASVYEKWYQKHTAAEYLARAVYGLPEIYRDEISTASLTANPGCYPTSIILALAPLLENRAIVPQSIIADSKSGVSGAGRAASVATLFCETADGFRPYKVADHRHTPEIEQEVSLLAGENVTLSFTPHLLPVSRGILSTIYATLQDGITVERVQEMFLSRYQQEKFVRILGENEYPATQYVRGSNFCDIGFKIDPRTNRIIVMSAIDNIVKGAAGQAVQNMNIMCGFDEGEGLAAAPFFP
ncbi:N-acetyl-gamma-glutamyl-phosphate reductase [Desulfopila inferna]|uniref:N-acetyl-gamma-glutamyl-phosphate reductase n=1 Tax=Desulfopila inferna TaxID=468528 RepID=UPI0019626A20|nr:N-acetyl-gamma-glutamyl-phosphate reductase [Desulfopila inferna]MBM9603388.1 N-acetyl-gamma-glutamyl-phosphate reductase [Desulfopila inferna]